MSRSRHLSIAASLALAAACSSGAHLATGPDAGTTPADGSLVDAAAGVDSAAGEDASDTDVTGAADGAVASCSGRLDDAGGAPPSLDDISLARYCPGGLYEWTCQGSIILEPDPMTGGDCFSFLLYDPSTHLLQATASGCNGSVGCDEGAAGFQFPSACFSQGGPPPGTTTPVDLCRQDAGSDAAHD